MTERSIDRIPGLSTTQAGVQILQNIAQCGMDGASYEKEVEDLHGLMSEFAITEIRPRYPELQALGSVHEAIEYATHEDRENQQVALDYWAATSLFFRKVYHAAAQAA